MRGGGGATNLRLTPKAVSVALGALRRQPARSPWIGGRTRRRHTNTKICACRNQSRQTEKISPSHTCIHTDRTNTEVVPLYTLLLSHTYTPPLAVRNSINILVQGREASVCLHGLLRTSSSPPLLLPPPSSPPSYWEISFLSQFALG